MGGRLPGQEALDGFVAHPEQRFGVLPFDQAVEILADDPEMEGRDVAETDYKRRRTGRGDDGFGPDIELPGRDAGLQGRAIGRSERFRPDLPAALGQGEGGGEIAAGMDLLGPVVQDQGGQRRSRMGFGQFAEPIDIALGGAFPGGFVPDEAEAVEIGVQGGVLVRIKGMEAEQILVELQGPKSGRINVRRAGGVAKKSLGRVQDGRSGLDDEGILGQRRRLFPGGIELEGFIDDEIIEGRTQGRAHVPGLQKIGIEGQGDFLQGGIVLEDVPVESIDLAEDPFQVPGRKIIILDAGGRRPVQKAPLVSRIILPIPARQNNAEDRRHGRRGPPDLLPDP